MTTRALRLAAMLMSLVYGSADLCHAAITAAGQQTAADTDEQLEARDLIDRLERVVQSADVAGYDALLSPSADIVSVTAFAKEELRVSASRVSIQERERLRLTRPGVEGLFFRLIVDVFAEYGGKGRVATWQLDTERASDGRWRITAQERLSSVENLYRLSLNRTRQFTARNFTVKAEDLDLTLIEGTVFSIDTDTGTTGLVLMGRGEMRFRPTPDTEQGQVRLFTGEPAIEGRFDAAYIRMGAVEPHASLGQLVERSVDARDLRRAEQVFREESGKSFVIDLGDLSRDAWSLLPSYGDFLAEVRTRRFNTLTYARSESEPEDISVFDRRRQRNICVYASAEKLQTRGRFYDEDALAAYDVLHYDIDLTMSPERLWLDGEVALRLRIKTNGVNQITLRLADTLVVRSIVSDRFGRLFSLRARGQNAVLVNLPVALLSGSELTLTIAYAGRLEPQSADRETVNAAQSDAPQRSSAADLPPVMIPRGEPNFLYSNRSYWYPQAPISDFATARMYITVPSPYVCVASGELLPKSPVFVSAVGSQPGKMYMFRAERPLRYLSFIVSRFERAEGPTVVLDEAVRPAPRMAAAVSAAPSLTLSSPAAPVQEMRTATPYRSFALTAEANPRQAPRSRDGLNRAAEIARFYESVVGDVPYASFTLALTEHETPGGHSPGYFAVLNQPFPNSQLVWRNDPASFEGYPEFFLAHELAHQWWGQAVGWRNYHEQWLSEGFAQYFAALYAQHHRGNETFGSVLRQMRKWAIDTSDQGPVYLGYRLGHIRNEGRVHRALVYNKGGAVLHMLRRLLGDDAFFRGVRRFYDEWRYKKAGTDDLRVAMEAESGRSLERFFERWIYGATLPQVKYSYRTDTGPTGTSLLIHVEQDGDLFDLPITFVIDYHDRPSTDLVIPVSERITDVRVALDGALRSVEASKNDGTLAEIERIP
jgi:hypothetical protein